MVWNSIFPLGTVSVRSNRTIGQENVTYTETTMNNDHFWNIGANQDGRHNAINMPLQASDPATSTGMNGTMYLKTVSGTNARIQGYYRNVNGIYQFIPCFQTGTVNLTNFSDFFTVTSVPSNSYGHIYMFKSVDDKDGQNMGFGFFKSYDGKVQAYGCASAYDSDSSVRTPNIQFGNGNSADALNVKAKLNTTSTGIYEYRIVYWGI